MLHWLVAKRSKGLIGEQNRNKSMHLRLVILYWILIAFDSIVSYIFLVQFNRISSKMNDIYIIAGFEFVRLLIKVLEDHFKYQISLAELYYEE